VRKEAEVYEDVVRDQIRLKHNDSPDRVDPMVVETAIIRAKIEAK